jgi:hypothetical protein
LRRRSQQRKKRAVFPYFLEKEFFEPVGLFLFLGKKKAKWPFVIEVQPAICMNGELGKICLLWTNTSAE